MACRLPVRILGRIRPGRNPRKTFPRCSGEEAVAEEAVLVGYTRQGEEESATFREDVLLERFAGQSILHGQESLARTPLVGSEGQAHIQPPGRVEAPRVGEATPEDQVLLALGRASANTSLLAIMASISATTYAL